MARSNHPSKHNENLHPYWKFWWSKHGPSRVRRMYNKIDRAKEKRALRRGLDEHNEFVEEPVPRRNYIGYIFW